MTGRPPTLPVQAVIEPKYILLGDWGLLIVSPAWNEAASLRAFPSVRGGNRASPPGTMIQILRCSRPKVCPELYLSLEDNFIFIADHEPYPVDVDKKGSNINTLHMRTGL